jgi:hypothetical protein
MALAFVGNGRGMVERIPPLAALWPVGSSLGVICLLFSFASVAVGEDGWRWRIDKIDDGRLLLAFTEFEAGDSFSGLSYYCKPSSGRIEVRGATNKQQRQVFADLVRTDSYPRLKVEGEDAFWELSHSDDVGWEFHFEIAADGAMFDKFKKTGQFEFKVGTLAVDNGTRKVGLDKVSEFQAACRLAADKVFNRPKPEQLFPDPHSPVPSIVKP